MFRKEYFGRSLVTICGLFLILLTAAVAGFLFYRGTAVFVRFDHSIADFLLESRWSPKDDFQGGGEIGVLVYLVGSLLTCTLALLISAPLGIASAIFLSELAPNIGDRFFRPAIEIFVGIPSVVYGWVGLTVLVPKIAALSGRPHGFSVLAAAIVLAVMIYPTITSLSADALKAVPEGYRQAAWGMGSTHWQVIWKVVLPAARTGIYTGIVLGLARAFGEALAVAMVIGKMRAFPADIFSPTINLTAAIAADMGGAADGGEYNLALWSMALLLFLISCGFIMIVHGISAAEQRRLKGGKDRATKR